MSDDLIERVARWMCDQSPYSADDWRDYVEDAMSLLRAIDLPARLEAARTQGWNEAIEAALAEVITDKTIERHGAHCCCATCELNVAEAGIRALTKENSDASSV